MAKLDARDRVRLVIVAYGFGLVPTGKNSRRKTVRFCRAGRSYG
ncbi:MAG TPA: hypothetical protein VG247_02790 [Pseudonocardiaceae bacterium]|jgi:hypothetical protein|nr:hypothetical protein [Pseudonocardiaceae bacterium]